MLNSTVLLMHFNLFTQPDVNAKHDVWCFPLAASLHDPKLHTCQQEATGQRKGKITNILFINPTLQVHPLITAIHVWENDIMKSS